MNITELNTTVITDIPTYVGIATFLLSVLVLKYTKETLDLTKKEQEARIIEESLHKFYNPLKELLAQHPFDSYPPIIDKMKKMKESHNIST